MVTDPKSEADSWLRNEDESCHSQRVERLVWLSGIAPRASIWTLPGGWLSFHLFENTRYSFVYGQFVATSIAGFSFVERTLSAMFYGEGRRDVQTINSQALLKEALKRGWLTQSEWEALDKARRMRNPLTHFRRPLHEDLPETRAMKEGRDPNEVLESDAKHILEAVFRIIALNGID